MCVCSFVFFCRVPFLQCFFVYFVYFVFASLFSSYADVVVLGAAGRLLEQPDCITGPSTAESEIATQESGGAKAYAQGATHSSSPTVSGGRLQNARRTMLRQLTRCPFLSLPPIAFSSPLPFSFPLPLVSLRLVCPHTRRSEAWCLMPPL